MGGSYVRTLSAFLYKEIAVNSCRVQCYKHSFVDHLNLQVRLKAHGEPLTLSLLPWQLLALLLMTPFFQHEFLSQVNVVRE